MKKILLVLLSFIMLFSTACMPSGQSTTTTGKPSNPLAVYRTITPRGVKSLLDKSSDIVLVDVRRVDEYEEKHIPSAINIPNEAIGTSPVDGLDDLDADIIVYCRSGNRSKEAAKKLLKIGYTNVRDMGGIDAWTYETVSGADAGVWIPEVVIEKTGILGNFTVKTLDGNIVSESILVDYKLTMVNIWATYCGPCLNEMPDLGALAAEYQSKGVQIIGVVSDVFNSNGSVNDRQVETAKIIVNQTGANYLHLIPTSSLNKLMDKVRYVPTTIFVDENGEQVGDLIIGSKTKEEWIAIIDALIAEVEG